MSATSRAHFVRGPALAMILCLAMVLPGTQAAMICIDVLSPETTVAVSQSVDVMITADLPEEILGFGLDLIFDDTLLAVESVQISHAFLPLPAPDGDQLAAIAHPNKAVGNRVELATVRFLALAPGFSEISVAFTAGDLTEGLPEASMGWAELTDVRTAKITVEDAGTSNSPSGPTAGTLIIPEPATLTMAMLALLLRQRRCNGKRSH